MSSCPILLQGRLGWKGLSVEKNCQLAKREGLGNANLIPIEQAVTQARVQEQRTENWSSRMMLKCRCVCIHPIRKLASLTYCPNALSLLAVLPESMTTLNICQAMLRECSGTPLLLKQTARQQRGRKKRSNLLPNSLFCLIKIKTNILQVA